MIYFISVMFAGYEMPKCNIAKTVHNKWLQQFGKKMTCLYETIVDDFSVHSRILKFNDRG